MPDLVAFLRARLDEMHANAYDCPCVAGCERKDAEQVLATVAALRLLADGVQR